ncbi:hypothetical protein MKQ68_17075 [Chitinophaga horti]|uniref:Uncharacterized protein n=1 Tax=Chitinophaga horti TaxID=2920382 RepID=A0ABY6IX76_9BACT|nr:hypothetical protein [Chitinophaga horti]UYQ91801.1 hypothetical protein MKQ68_17075 [Chitinophaga horti]
MKKLITAALALLMTASVAFAQEKQKAAKAKPATEHVKKDGTPDKRYKENKEAKSEGPKKKDGTPDMRYKENKEKKPAKKETKPAAKKAA